ncbi:MAG TPA: DNA repair protein RecO [Patescibacteria group bacterium]|jgi:DNA repair protein RecO (recombination protein O)|nr:DNA repair protein RecO [Patescibacteria group bacterium]
MATTRTRAIVLRRTNYGEADRILKLLTPDGQASVIARGVRREKSKLAGGIELFGLSDITIHSGKGDLGVLTSARLDTFFEHILQDYDRLQFGYEAINAVSKASDSIDEPAWFTILEQVYRGLDEANVPLQLTQTWFYLRYAEITGYELSLDRDVSGNKLMPDKRYMYDVGEKGLRLSEQGDITADHIKYLRLIAAKPLLTVAQVGGVEDVLPDCWLLARQAAVL